MPKPDLVDAGIAPDQPPVEDDGTVSLNDAFKPVVVPDDQAPVDEEVYVSDNVSDWEPPDAGPPPFDPAQPEVGQFVAVGAEHVAVDGHEWAVDPVTGLVTGAA